VVYLCVKKKIPMSGDAFIAQIAAA
jgi:hypothetical protein